MLIINNMIQTSGTTCCIGLKKNGLLYFAPCGCGSGAKSTLPVSEMCAASKKIIITTHIYSILYKIMKQKDKLY
jgi:hypothetical protein